MPSSKKPGPFNEQLLATPVARNGSATLHPTPTLTSVAPLNQTAPSTCQEAWTVRLPIPEGDDARPWFCSISFELEEACQLPEGPGNYPGEWRRVLTWLRKHQDVIVQAERKWSVDRRAIAGAIAWEALENGGAVKNWLRAKANIHRFGIAKVHPYENGRDSIAQEVEKAGYLIVRDTPEREKQLSSIEGAVDYIAAIMRASADVVSTMGGYPPSDTYWNPSILATWYQSKYLSTLKTIYSARKYPTPLSPGDVPMGKWVRDNLPYLKDAVGMLPDGCRPDIQPIPGTHL